MSAYFVSKTHIDVLVSALIEFKVYITLDRKHYGYAKEMDPIEVGKLLWLENVRSVTHRYDLDVSACRDRQDEHAEYVDAIVGYRFEQYHGIKPGPLAHAVGCYEYQSCEHDEWETSIARDIVIRLQDKLCTFLPGYNDGPWGIDGIEDLAKVCNPAVVSLSRLAKRGRK